MARRHSKLRRLTPAEMERIADRALEPLRDGDLLDHVTFAALLAFLVCKGETDPAIRCCVHCTMAMLCDSFTNGVAHSPHADLFYKHNPSVHAARVQCPPPKPPHRVH